MKKKIVADYIILQFIYYMSAAVICGYGAYLLIAIGYDSAKTGILISLGCLLSFILNPILSDICDNNKKFNIYRMGITICEIALVISIAAYFQDTISILTSISFILLRCLHSVLESFINSIPHKMQQHGYEINFGYGRAAGSFSYAIFSIILGFLTEAFPYKVVHIMNIISYVLTLLTYAIIKKHNKDLPEIEETNTKEEIIPYSLFAKRHYMFIFLCISFAGIYFGYGMADNFMVKIVENLGGGEQYLGLILGFKAMIEIPIICFYDKIEKHFSNKTLLRVASIGFSIKSFLLYFANSIPMVFLAQLMQPIGLALMIPALVSFINKLMNKKEAVRGQALYVMSTTISTVIATAISGNLVQIFSVKTMLLFGFIITSVSALLFNLILNKCK